MYSTTDAAAFFDDMRAYGAKKAHADAPESAHGYYAKVLEEVDELWDMVKLKPRHRDLDKMREECVQIAARAMLFAMFVCVVPGK